MPMRAAISRCRKAWDWVLSPTLRSWKNIASRKACLFRTVLCGRGGACVLCRRRVRLLFQILGHLLLAGLKIVDGLLQRDRCRLENFDLAVCGVQPLLIVAGQLADGLLQK